MHYQPALMMLSLTALLAVIFSFVGVIKWAQERRKEREAFYVSEMVKKLADSQSTSPAELLRQLEANRSNRVREGMRMGGFIGTFASAALLVFLWAVTSGHGYLVALIPLSASAALFLYAQFLATRSPNTLDLEAAHEAQPLHPSAASDTTRTTVSR